MHIKAACSFRNWLAHVLRYGLFHAINDKRVRVLRQCEGNLFISKTQASTCNAINTIMATSVRLRPSPPSPYCRTANVETSYLYIYWYLYSTHIHVWFFYGKFVQKHADIFVKKEEEEEEKDRVVLLLHLLTILVFIQQSVANRKMNRLHKLYLKRGKHTPYYTFSHLRYTMLSMINLVYIEIVRSTLDLTFV